MKKWTTIIFAWVAVIALLLIVARFMLPMMGLAGVEGEYVQPLVRLMPASITMLVGSIAMIVFDLRRQAKFVDVRPKRLVDEAEGWSSDFVVGEGDMSRRVNWQPLASMEPEGRRKNGNGNGAGAKAGRSARVIPERKGVVEEVRAESVSAGAAGRGGEQVVEVVYAEPVEESFEMPERAAEAEVVDCVVVARSEDQMEFSPAEEQGEGVDVVELEAMPVVERRPLRVTVDLPEEPAIPEEVSAAGAPGVEAEQEADQAERAVVSQEVVARYRHLVDAAQSSATSLNQLPPPLPEFTGREFELEEFVAEHNRFQTRLLGMQGLGGVGKTTLALKLADQLKEQYPDAQFYLDLKGASPLPLPVAEAQAHIIRAYLPTVRLPESEAELNHLYRSLLLDKRVLLLLDNAVNTQQVQGLVAPGECLTIITSRQPVLLPGMFSRQLEGLPAPEAREILQRLAPRVGALADRVAELCGYLPLALRLAASTLAFEPSLRVEEYVDRLGELKQTERLRHPVDAVVTLAYDLLAPSLQKLWRLLAVFSDTFDGSAAASIWTLNPAHAETALDRLLAGSLIERNRASGRYRLHDLMSAFAETRLTEEERALACQRHSAHYQSVLHEADALYEQGGDLFKLGLDLVDMEWMNIQSGQVWAASNMTRDRAACELCNSYPDAGKFVLDLRQHPRERIRWSEAALEAAQRMNRSKSSARHLIGLGDSYIALSEVHHAIEFYERGLKLASGAKDRRAEAESLSGLGNAYYLGGGLGRAREVHEKAMELFAALGDRRGVADSLGNLGMAHYAMGEVRKAADLFARQLKAARESGDRRNESIALGGLGLTQYVMGDSRRAAELFNQQLAITREIGDRRGEAVALSNLGNACATLEYTQQAIAYHEQALTIAREMSDRRAEATALGGLGVAEYLAKNVARSVELLESQLKLTREIGDRRGEAIALGNLGEARIASGDAAAAIEPLKQAFQVASQIGDVQAQGNALFHLAIALDDLGERKQAIRQAESALELFRVEGHPSADLVKRQLDSWRG
ncbi:MAG: tetratricopeptide repeat protein [Blastocatellia bacterium]|nr:tetratricopeptide repeat protein [Blastocatellia bacterium]